MVFYTTLSLDSGLLRVCGLQYLPWPSMPVSEESQVLPQDLMGFVSRCMLGLSTRRAQCPVLSHGPAFPWLPLSDSSCHDENFCLSQRCRLTKRSANSRDLDPCKENEIKTASQAGPPCGKHSYICWPFGTKTKQKAPNNNKLLNFSVIPWSHKRVMDYLKIIF